MTQEEKAKAYDRVSKEVKDFLEGKQKMYSDITKTLEYLFPELKESEDERISKVLIELVEEYKELSPYGGGFGGLKWDKLIAWLEKQGEKIIPNMSGNKDNDIDICDTCKGQYLVN